MMLRKIAFIPTIAIIIGLCSLSTVSLVAAGKKKVIEVTAGQLNSDFPSIKTHVMKKIADDLKKAKKYGKGLAKAFAGISSYTFDAIPFEFYTNQQTIDKAMDDVFKRRLEESIKYIQEAKEEYKKTLTGAHRKLSQNKLGEFLYRRVVVRVTVTPEQRVLLEKEPLKMDEFVRSGIVKKDEYMYFTLLNFIVRYYLEQELKR